MWLMLPTSLRLFWSLLLLQKETDIIQKTSPHTPYCEEVRGVAMVTQPTSVASLPLVYTSPSISHSDCLSPQMHLCRLREGERGGEGDKGR